MVKWEKFKSNAIFDQFVWAKKEGKIEEQKLNYEKCACECFREVLVS